MPVSEPRLPTFVAGTRPMEGDLNALSRGIRDLAHDLPAFASTGGQLPSVAGFPVVDIFMGIVSANDGAGSTAKLAQYNVDRGILDGSATGIGVLKVQVDKFPGLKANVIATNLAELKSDGTSVGTHLVPTGQNVIVLRIMNRGGKSSGGSASASSAAISQYVFWWSTDGGCLVKPTAAGSGGGKYTGNIWTPPTSDISASGTLVESDIGTAGTSCIILNTREVGKTTHDIAFSGFLPLIFPGRIIHINADGTPVVAIDGNQWEDCT